MAFRVVVVILRVVIGDLGFGFGQPRYFLQLREVVDDVSVARPCRLVGTVLEVKIGHEHFMFRHQLSALDDVFLSRIAILALRILTDQPAK